MTVKKRGSNARLRGVIYAKDKAKLDEEVVQVKREANRLISNGTVFPSVPQMISFANIYGACYE